MSIKSDIAYLICKWRVAKLVASWALSSLKYHKHTRDKANNDGHRSSASATTSTEEEDEQYPTTLSHHFHSNFLRRFGRNHDHSFDFIYEGGNYLESVGKSELFQFP